MNDNIIQYKNTQHDSFMYIEINIGCTNKLLHVKNKEIEAAAV
jgi:hypothetical protein